MYDVFLVLVGLALGLVIGIEVMRWAYRPLMKAVEELTWPTAAATPQEDDTSWLDDRSDTPCDYCGVPDGYHTIDELRSCHADLDARARQQGTDFR